MGANAFTINRNKEYVEVFAGFENLLKIARFDWVWGFEQGRVSTIGFRLGIRGFGKL
jgi:hypothetical protein